MEGTSGEERGYRKEEKKDSRVKIMVVELIEASYYDFGERV